MGKKLKRLNTNNVCKYTREKGYSYLGYFKKQGGHVIMNKKTQEQFRFKTYRELAEFFEYATCVGCKKKKDTARERYDYNNDVICSDCWDEAFRVHAEMSKSSVRRKLGWDDLMLVKAFLKCKNVWHYEY